MEPSELLAQLAEVLERLGIAYRVTGSMAAMAYGEARFTNDIDVVVRLLPTHVAAFCAAFPAPDFYTPVDSAREAVRDRFQFNVLHHPSGLKIDVMVAGDSAFDQSRFARGRRMFTDAHHEAWFASPEDVILKKLVYFREGGSEKHLRDIVGILKVQAELIEFDYLAEWVARLGVADEWQLVISRMGSSAK